MAETKIYCGHASEHDCHVQVIAETEIVLAERDLDASSWGDESKQRRTIRSYFVPEHLPPGWKVVGGPGRYMDVSFDA